MEDEKLVYFNSLGGYVQAKPDIHTGPIIEVLENARDYAEDYNVLRSGAIIDDVIVSEIRLMTLSQVVGFIDESKSAEPRDPKRWFYWSLIDNRILVDMQLMLHEEKRGDKLIADVYEGDKQVAFEIPVQGENGGVERFQEKLQLPYEKGTGLEWFCIEDRQFPAANKMRAVFYGKMKRKSGVCFDAGDRERYGINASQSIEDELYNFYLPLVHFGKKVGNENSQGELFERSVELYKALHRFLKG